MALPFGLSSSCKAFHDLICALVGSWRRYQLHGDPVRASSYIDDVHAVTKLFDQAMRMSIYMVYEAASLDRPLITHRQVFLLPQACHESARGTIVDLKAYKFRVASSRALKIRSAIACLQEAVKERPKAVPTRMVVSFVGLMWSIAACCHRAVSIMVRSITAVLTSSLKGQIPLSRMPLSHIVNRFWHGTVEWTQSAQLQLDFWSEVDFESPISADVLGRAADSTIWYPQDFDHTKVSFLAQDASGVASGGGAF